MNAAAVSVLWNRDTVQADDRTAACLWIDREQLLRLADVVGKSSYSKFLRDVAAEEIF